MRFFGYAVAGPRRFYDAAFAAGRFRFAESATLAPLNAILVFL